MRIILQRSKEANVKINNETIGSINYGLVLLVGFAFNDGEEEIDYLVDKVINLRIFDDENGIMNKSLLEVNGSILSISQFTLYADINNGRRPSYIKALKSEEARKLYEIFNKKLRDKNIKVETGLFGSNMQVNLINDGPVTIILEKEKINEKK